MRKTLTSAVANSTITLAELSQLAFPTLLSDGVGVEFTVKLIVDTAATTTGLRLGLANVSGNPSTAPTRLAANVRIPISATQGTGAMSDEPINAYDDTTATPTMAFTTGNIVIMEGIIVPSVNTIVVPKFASEVAASAVTVQPGSWIEWNPV